MTTYLGAWERADGYNGDVTVVYRIADDDGMIADVTPTGWYDSTGTPDRYYW